MERYSFNPVAKTLVITAAFAKAIQDINSEEYALYTQLMADIPNLEVIRKTHKTPTKYQTKSGEKFNCNQFKNLTYKNMETFIMGLPAAEAYMNEYTSLTVLLVFGVGFLPSRSCSSALFLALIASVFVVKGLPNSSFALRTSFFRPSAVTV